MKEIKGMTHYLLRGLVVGLVLSVLNLLWNAYSVVPFGVDAVKWSAFSSLLMTVVLVAISVGFSFVFAQRKLREGGKQLSLKDSAVERIVLFIAGALLLFVSFALADFETIVDGFAKWLSA